MDAFVLCQRGDGGQWTIVLLPTLTLVLAFIAGLLSLASEFLSGGTGMIDSRALKHTLINVLSISILNPAAIFLIKARKILTTSA